MPFSARVIETREDIPEVFQGNAVKVLEKANVSNMIGLLEQLNQVSKFASEVFADILKDTEKNSIRIKECRSRISRIDSKVAPIEKMFVDRAPSYFYDNPYVGSEWKRKDALKGLIFRRDRAIMEVNRRRNEADPPPNLSALDNYSKVPCIKKFTDSNFFMNEWMEAEKKKIEQEKAKKKARKKRKKKKREEKKTIKAIAKKRYDPVTGKMIEIKDEDIVVKQYTLTGDIAQPTEFAADYDPKKSMARSPNPNSIIAKTQPNGARPPPNPLNGNRGPPPMKGARPPPFKPVVDDIKQDIPNGKGPPAFKPPIFNPSANAQPPPVPNAAINRVNSDSASINGPSVPPPNPYANESSNAPPPNPYANESVPVKLTGVQMALMSAKRAEQSQMYQQQNKPKPQLAGMKSALLLGQIKSGTKLRKAAPVKRKVPQDKRSMLMANLRSGTKLRVVDQKKIDSKKEKKNENEGGIFAILNRRQFLADDDSDSEEGSSMDWSEEDD